MMTTNFSPPHSPSSDALMAAHSLIAIAADPAGAKKRIDELTAATAEIHAALKELEEARGRNQKALEAVADLRRREEAVATRETELQVASTRLAVASSAHSEREAQLNRRQADLDTHARDLSSRELALAEAAEGLSGGVSLTPVAVAADWMRTSRRRSV
jgi:hypothetical protein